MGVGTRTTRTILTDVVAADLAAALSARWEARMQPRTARGEPDAVDVVASLDPGVVVVAPAAAAGATEPGDLHRAIAERTRWWSVAGGVTGAFVVLVSEAEVFGLEVGAGGGAPDEFSHPAPAGMPGRAWRAAEHVVLACGGAVVRHDPTTAADAARAVADLVEWVVAGRRAGVWHVGGERLDDLHTRIVRGVPAGPDEPRFEDD